MKSFLHSFTNLAHTSKTAVYNLILKWPIWVRFQLECNISSYSTKKNGYCSVYVSITCHEGAR